MNKKYWLSLYLVFLALALLAAQCTIPVATQPAAAPSAGEAAAEAGPAGAEEVPAEAAGSIRFLAYPWFALSDEALAKFTEETGIEVTQEVLGYEELNTKVAVSSAAQTAPADVFSTYVVPLAGHVQAGFVAPIDDYMTDELREDMLGLDVFKFGGKQMGLPTYYDVTGMVVNQTLLEQAGVERIPETIAELRDAALKIKEAGVANYPLVLPLAAQAGTASRWYVLSMALSGEPLFDENYQPLFTAEDSGGYQALQFMVDSIGEIIDPAMVELIDIETHDVFLAGDGAFIFSGTTMLQFSDDPEKSAIVDDDVVAALIPGSDKTRSAALNFYLDGMAISEFSENKDAAWKFMAWWVSPETAQAVWNEQGTNPSRKSLLSKFVEEGTIPGGNFIFEQSEYGMPLFPAGIPPWFEEWETEVANQVNQAARGTITVEQALANIANKAQELQQ